MPTETTKEQEDEDTPAVPEPTPVPVKQGRGRPPKNKDAASRVSSPFTCWLCSQTLQQARVSQLHSKIRSCSQDGSKRTARNS